MVILLDHRNFPAELTALPNWVCWRMEPDKRTGRATKVPYNPATGYKASSSDPQTWGTLAQALDGMARFMFTGMGFVFTEEIGYVGIDIDGCLDDSGQPNKVTAAILAKVPPTYIEITPSGRGLHIFLRGALSKGGMKSAKNGVEMYAKARYFTMTGNKYSSCVDKIADDNGALDFIQAHFIASAAKVKKKSTSHPGRPLADDELLDLAKGSKDGDSFKALWDGLWQGSYPSQSEADFALCRKLAFWSGRNEAQVDRLFRQSGLFREKWDRKHNADGSTYGETTVSRACEGARETYTPPPKQQIDVFEHSGAYWRNRNQKVYALTNWVGYEQIDCVVLDIDMAREKALNIALNKIGGEFDNIKLSGLLRDLIDTGFDSTLTGFDDDEQNQLFASITREEAKIKEDAYDAEAEAEKIENPVSRPGDIWLLGRHRLICGDSTDIGTAARLMDGTRAKLVFTDPPWNVDYGRAHPNWKKRSILNDNMSADAFYTFLLSAFKAQASVSEPGAMLYCVMSAQEWPTVHAALREAGYRFRCFMLHIGMIGGEYATARTTLLRPLSGNSGWLVPPEKAPAPQAPEADSGEEVQPALEDRAAPAEETAAE